MLSDHKKRPDCSEYLVLRSTNGRVYYFTPEDEYKARQYLNIYKRDISNIEWTLTWETTEKQKRLIDTAKKCSCVKTIERPKTDNIFDTIKYLAGQDAIEEIENERIPKRR